jgi:hypothetical protein
MKEAVAELRHGLDLLSATPESSERARQKLDPAVRVSE